MSHGHIWPTSTRRCMALPLGFLYVLCILYISVFGFCLLLSKLLSCGSFLKVGRSRRLATFEFLKVKKLEVGRYLYL